MKYNLETIKRALEYHWKHQDKVSYDVLKEKIEGFEKELRDTKALAEKILRNKQPSHFRSEAKGAFDEIEEVLGE